MTTKKQLLEMLAPYPDDMEVCVESSVGDIDISVLPIGDGENPRYLVLEPKDLYR